MKLMSINIGKEETLVRPNSTEQTGIFKRPVTGTVRLETLGIPGDFIGDKKHHGGPDQAIYIYTTDDYDWWAQKLGRALEPGTFGDNLTISGLLSADCNVGDMLYVGEAVLQVTSPRIPCGTLAGRMQLPDFVKQFRHAERPGIYVRVLHEGSVQAGDAVRYEAYAGATLSMRHAMRDHYEPQLNETAIQQFLAAPIAERWRVKKEGQLQKLREGA